MKVYTQDELNVIVEYHGKWLRSEEEGCRADLRGAYLGRADLREADLSRADLRGADLCRAHLRGADLSRAHLRGAYLCRAHLRGADLREADLREADLREADLREADLRGAYLSRADLRRADLRGAGLRGITMNWKSNELISECLWQVAASIPREMLAAFIGRKTGWCWDDWAKFRHREKKWAIGVLKGYVKEDDGAPEVLK